MAKNPVIIHYCHSPTRYLHGLVTEMDHQAFPFWIRIILPPFIFLLRRFDLQAAHRLNKNNAVWIGNSSYITGLIKSVYGAEAKTVFPPIETGKFLDIVRIPKSGIEEFYLFHNRLSMHKRADVAILACLRLKRKLKISGTSPNVEFLNYLKKLASDYITENANEFLDIPNGGSDLIEWMGRTTYDDYISLLAECKAVLYPPKEDFGIAPIEAIAAGVPILAYGQGGALEYVVTTGEFQNGLLFYEQTPESLISAILSFEKQTNEDKNLFDITKMRKSIEKFAEIYHDKAIREVAGF